MKILCCCVAIVMMHTGAVAATLSMGPSQRYKTLNEAIAAAAPGDTIHVAAGTYRDCAVWQKDNLTIEGEGEATEFVDVSCRNAGILVIDAPRAMIRNLTLAGAAVADGNGSGIRDNALHLLVENCIFRGNQDGILTFSNGAAELVVRSSTFVHNGACVPDKGCAHGIYAGFLGLVHIENSRFFDSQAGHHIKSRARRTEVVGNTIEDGPDGTSSYLVDVPEGGSLLMTGNTLQKGPHTQNPSAAVTIGEEGGKRAPAPIVISGNSFRNDGPRTVFVRNATKSIAELRDNVVAGPMQVLSGPGSVD